MISSGVRIGATAMTIKGMKEGDMDMVGGLINEVAENAENMAVLDSIKKRSRSSDQNLHWNILIITKLNKKLQQSRGRPSNTQKYVKNLLRIKKRCILYTLIRKYLL